MPDAVGYFPYLNIWPFVRGLPEDIERVVAAPRALVEFAQTGRLDVAILPVVDVPTLADRYEPLGDLGLAVAGPVWSVLLLAQRPVGALTGARICATPESSVSVRLLTVLLRDRYGVWDWRWSPTPEEAEAWLVIGDTALAIYLERSPAVRACENLVTPAPVHAGAQEPGRPEVRKLKDLDVSSAGNRCVEILHNGSHRLPNPEWLRDRTFQLPDGRMTAGEAVVRAQAFPFMYDLGDEWTRWQGRPFVFARWVVRRDRPAAWRRAWYERLSAALEAYLPQLYGGGPVDGLRPWQIEYLRRFEYRLSPAALDGWERFYRMEVPSLRSQVSV
ncbi:MAG: hypothetical protein NZ742_02625 [Acidobacteria bacterium]|nr:hypothetical protein [Acidobacteriota bacterium]MDW7983842.1 MqnA/MqnD/SBP family protein [Acidobacteriota bacterium]